MDDGDAAAGLFHFTDGGFEEEHLAVADGGHARAEASGKAFRLLVRHGFLLILPFAPERRIAEDIVKRVACELVVGKRVAGADVRGVFAFDERVRLADGECLVVNFLPVGDECRGGVELFEVFARDGEHAAGAAGGIVKRLDGVGRGEHFIVVHEEDVDHEPDEFARRVVLPGILVAGLGEFADDFFKDVSHFQIGNVVGMEVAFLLREFLQDDVEDAFLVHARDFGIEIEPLDDFAHVRRESLQVLAEVRRDVVGVVEQRLERVRARVVEGMSGDFAKALVHHLGIDPIDRRCLVHRLGDLFLRAGQHAVKAPDHCQRQNDVAILMRLVDARQLVGDGPDEVCFFFHISKKPHKSFLQFFSL